MVDLGSGPAANATSADVAPVLETQQIARRGLKEHFIHRYLFKIPAAVHFAAATTAAAAVC